VRDYVIVHGPSTSSGAGGASSGGGGASSGGGGAATETDVAAALDLYDVDAIGLDRLDRAVLDAVVRRFRGGPVGLNTLAVTVGEEAETIESVVEPYLVRIGFLGRTPRGRIATPEAYAHLRVPHVDESLRLDDL
jgi:Holliday junction DNA helicase RuvB